MKIFEARLYEDLLFYPFLFIFIIYPDPALNSPQRQKQVLVVAALNGNPAEESKKAERAK
jgi:hypothetical protein